MKNVSDTMKKFDLSYQVLIDNKIINGNYLTFAERVDKAIDKCRASVKAKYKTNVLWITSIK